MAANNYSPAPWSPFFMDLNRGVNIPVIGTHQGLLSPGTRASKATVAISIDRSCGTQPARDFFPENAGSGKPHDRPRHTSTNGCQARFPTKQHDARFFLILALSCGGLRFTD
jgi:hypothetical protein